MSETKMTPEQQLENFRQEYGSILRRYERYVEKYTLKMNEDFEHFLRWSCDDHYKAVVNLKVLREFRPALYWDDVTKVEQFLRHQIESIELTLIDGRQYPTSANLMHNVAEILGREAKQGLRQDFQRLLEAVTYKG